MINDDNRSLSVPGWMTVKEIAAIHDIVQDAYLVESMMEIGCFAGRSAVAFGEAIYYRHGSSTSTSSIYCVDPWTHERVRDFPGVLEGHLNAPFTEDELDRSLFSAFLFHTQDFPVVPIRCSSLDLLKYWDKDMRAPNIVFIDGDHSYPMVLHDLVLATYLTRKDPRAIIAGHDYGHEYIPTVKQAVDDFCQKYNKLVAVYPDTTIFRIYNP